MQTLRSTILAFLGKVSRLLESEPARLIGYGAAVVVFLVIQVLNARGITRFGTDLNFEDAVIVTAAAMTLLATVVESIRRFVYSPLTYIEDLADESREAHEAAHLEEEFSRAMNEAIEEVKAKRTTKRAVAVGTAKADGSKDLSN